jgi:hypothetical protein
LARENTMQIKVYTIELKFPRWLKRVLVYAGIPAVVLLGVGVVVRAQSTLPVSVQSFGQTETLSATKMNTNFDNLVSGINSLNTTVGSLQSSVASLTAAAVPSGLIAMFATAACPAGWSPCDGVGGRPDINNSGSYPKGGTTFQASTGVNSHTHAITVNVAADGIHHHYAEFDWFASPGQAGYIYGHWTSYVGVDPSVVDGPWTAGSHLLTGGAGSTDGTVDTGGMLTTNVAAHSHPGTTGASAPASHEPVHVTLVFCIKN